MAPITLTPIGRVHSSRTEVKDDFWGQVTSVIELDAAHFTSDSLLGLTDFSHILVVYHLHSVPDKSIVTTASYPRENPDWPRVGIFAQRGKNRPNRIGSTIVRIVGHEGRVLRVAELDAIDNTPVIDIKPVMQEFLPREPVRQPQWSRELMQRYWSEG